jgi:nitrile hydratase subunit beta
MADHAAAKPPPIVLAEGEVPAFQPGDRVRVAVRYPVGHYRVPRYVRGKHGVVESVILPAAVNNEEEGYGRNAGAKRHYYRVAFPLSELWPNYAHAAHDGLRIEIFETWLERD